MIKLRVVICDKIKTKAIYDSGSNVTLISERIADLLKLKLIEKKNVLKTISGLNFTSARATILLRIGHITDYITTYVVKNDNFSYDILLGIDAIKKFRLIQNENLRIFQRTDNDNVIDLHENRSNSDREDNFNRSKLDQMKKNQIDDNRVLIDKDDSNDYIELNFNESLKIEEFDAVLSHIENVKQKQQITNLIEKHKHMFAKDKFDIGKVKSKEAEIKLLSNEYVTCRPYKCSIPDDEEIRNQIKALLQAKIIEDSDSPFASPVTLAFKKEENKKSRLCIDFRKLNKLVVPEVFPFPTIQDVIDKVVNCEYFTVLDINSAFWCITLKEEDREKTSFITRYGKFMFKVLPFGLKNAPATFQRILSNIIRRNGLDEFCINYIDDILIFSQTWEDHLNHIDKFLQVTNAEGFKLKLVKCLFAAKSVKYLGHTISKNRVSPAQGNLVSIQNLQRPSDKTGVRSVLGSINFYLRYIENSSQKLEPLHRLLRKDVKFEWSDDCEKAFNMIKDYLCTAPILSIYDYNKPVFIETDASFKGIGATLKQPQEDGILHPVAYYSRKLSEREKRLDIIHLECKAIKDAIKFWQYYLIGRHFTVCSDHKPLENLKTKARSDEILGDLILYLSQFNFSIIYKKGKENILADLLSRNPVLEYFNNEDAIRIVNLIDLPQILKDQAEHLSELKVAKRTDYKQGMILKRLKGKLRIFVSPKLGKEIIQLVHEHYGHIGPAQMIATIRPHYYFKGFDKEIHNFCKSCQICVRNKVRRSRAIGLLSQLGPATEPFQIMSLDTVGGFSGNRSPKKYMHILVDHFTRYAWISTSKGQSAHDFINLINPIAKDNNVSILLADQYTSVNSAQFQNYLEKKGIQIVFCCIDHPESNGLNERLNQTLVNRLRCKINSETKKAWPVLAKECVNEYNNTIHSSTRFAPSYLLLGKKQAISPLIEENPSSLEEDRKIAYQNSLRSFKINKERIDKNRRQHDFKIGDLVYIENGNKLNRNKLDPVRVGPFPIVRKITPTFYEVASGKKKKISNFFHSSKLLPFSPCESSSGVEV